MKPIGKLLFLVLVVINSSCSKEHCTINYKENFGIYENAVSEIFNLGLKMNSKETYYRWLKTIKVEDNIVDEDVFEEVEFIQCHEDSTIIFQAYNCNPQTALSDAIYVLAYSPQGIEHFKGKRNAMSIIKINENWFYAKHIETIAD